MSIKAINLVEESQPAQSVYTVGVLALQGAFLEHINVLRRLKVRALPVRKPEDLDALDGLIIPGGESTTIGKLLLRWELLDPLRNFIDAAKPVWGTCAGLILLAKDIGQTPQEGGAHVIPTRLAVIDIVVDRNAYGRQTDSFEADLPADWLPGGGSFPAVFIRAPHIEAIGEAVIPLLRYNNEVVAAVQNQQILVTTFHPELTGDSRLHEYFLSLIERCR
ncbi:MAG TPA: pyridoxal 5'-phosphate synthase glutaminase subunit PdxT [Chloroflexi bacterium]|nr:MAG: pyridoxal 5'-phosphate synthase glutaminase subunit PdxT [Anaerolineaceae bacterium 4572_5.2]HEY85009.1 pyridoxal 5'-phosphate synthase glutaminase subunit PdxT [Chloroflexota bacterium]